MLGGRGRETAATYVGRPRKRLAGRGSIPLRPAHKRKIGSRTMDEDGYGAKVVDSILLVLGMVLLMSLFLAPVLLH